MEIKPDKKLLVKQRYVLLTISFLILIVGTLLQILVPLDPKVTSAAIASILWPIVLGVLILFWLISYPLIGLWIKNLSFHIEEERVTIHKGILSKIKQNVPYRAITDFQLYQSLYDRFLGIASIKIQTAGQSPTKTGFEAKLSGLTDWDNLLDQLRNRVKMLYPASESSRTAISINSEKELLNKILLELTEIKLLLQKNN